MDSFPDHLKSRIFCEETQTKQRFLSPIINAMRKWTVIEFIYRDEDGDTYVHVAPVCLKEFEKHWYLIGSKNDEISIYLLNRIKAMDECDTTFSLPQNIDWNKFIDKYFMVNRV